MLEKLDTKRIHKVSTQESSATSVNLCSQDVVEEMEMMINYTYTESGKQLMILNIGAPVSLAGIPWMTQYLQEFGHTIEQLNSVKCSQLFVFGPSRRCLSKSLVKLPVLIKR